MLGFILFQTGALGDATINFSLRGFFSGENGLVAYYTFDGENFDISSSTAEVRDATGNGYNGNIVNNASTTDAIIDSTNLSATSTSFLNTSPAVVFTSKQDGYVFYVDTDATTRAGSCVMASTTDGGVTWSAPQIVDTVNTVDCMRVSVWYDGWTQTPAVSGTTSTTTKIHILTSDISVDDMYYTYLAFSTTTGIPRLSTTALTQTQGSTNAANTNFQSITRTATGTLFASFHDATDRYVLACSYNCETSANWTEISTTNYLSTVGDDWPILVPVPGTNNMMQIYNDISANYKSQIFSGTSSAWWATTSAMTMYITGAITENATYDATIGATVDWNNNKIYTAWANDNNDFSTQDHDLLFGSFSTDTWAWSTSTVASNIANRGISDVKVSYDHINDLVYLVYAAGSMSTSTTRVYYRTSADNGETWSAEQGPVDDTAYDKWGGANVPIMGENIYNFSLGSSTPASSTVQGRSVSAPFANYSFTEGRVGQGYEFDGVDDYVDLGSEAAFDNMTEGTVALWVRPYGSSTVAQALFSKDNTGNNNGDFVIVVNDSDDTSDVNKFQMQLTDDVPSTQIIASNNEASFNGWQHLAVTWGSGGMQMWVNGVLQTETLPAVTSGVDNASATLVLGAGLGGTSTFFDGVLDDVRIYNRALSADDITRIYKVGGTTKINQTLEVPNQAKSDLISHWTFDGSDMSTAATSTLVNDTFTEGANTTLAAHTPDVGSGYTALVTNGTCTNLYVAGATDVLDGAVSTASGGCGFTEGKLYQNNTAMPTPDYNVSATYTTIGTNETAMLLACRIQDSNNMYLALLWGDGALFKRVGGTWTPLTEYGGVFADGDRITLSCRGSNIELLQNGTPVLSAQDTSITAAGLSGIGMGDIAVDGFPRGVSDQVIDNFNVSTIRRVDDLGSADSTGLMVNGSSTPGRIGQGLMLGGASDYVIMGSTSAFQNSSFTVGGWMRLNESSLKDGQHDFIFVQDSDSTGGNDATLHLGIRGAGANSGKVVFGFFNDDLHSSAATYASTTQWIHIMGTYNVSTNERIIYVNGVQETSDTATGDYVGTGIICLSRCPFQPLSGQYMDGKLDDVRMYNRVLTADEINDIYSLGATSKLNTTIDPPSMSSDGGLIGHWSMDGKDYDGASTTGEILNRASSTMRLNNTSATQRPGRIGQGIQFNGTDGYLTARGTTDYNNIFSTPGTLAFWVYYNSTDVAGIMYKGNQNGVASGWLTGINLVGATTPDYALYFQRYTTGTTGSWYTSTSSLPMGQWNHVVIVYDDTTISNTPTIYINGEAQSLTNSSPSGSTRSDSGNAFEIGRVISDFNDYYNFNIDDIRIYNRLLTAAEAKLLYQMGQ